MNHRAVAEQLIASLGSVLSLPELKLDDVTHSCVLLFDQDIVLNIEFDDAGGQMIVSSYLDEAWPTCIGTARTAPRSAWRTPPTA
jgi:hypothetical protein